MTPVTTQHNIEETIRAREVYRYYQPHNSTESLATSESSSEEPTKFGTPQFVLDTALTAFAQLIAIRFGAQRAVISLIDHEHEFFLAESTSTLSLLDAKGYAENHFLSQSGSKVPRDNALGEQTLQLEPNQTTGFFAAAIFPDLRLNGKLSQLDCVAQPPYLRFYCGVPITNVKGINVGSLYVVDDATRTGASFEQLQFLTMMAATVMDHLENIRVREEVTRVTRMSQGLHAFIEGDGTMHGDWKRLRRYNLPAGAGIGYNWKSHKTDITKIRDSKQPRSPLKATQTTDSNRSISPGHSSARRPLAGNEFRRLNFNRPPLDSYSETDQAPSLKFAFDGITRIDGNAANEQESLPPADSYFSQETRSTQRNPHDALSKVLRGTFSRASNLIKEGMEVDGAVYVDASVGVYQGRSTMGTDPRHFDDPASASASPSADEDYAGVSIGTASHAEHSTNSSVSGCYYAGEPYHATKGSSRLNSDVLGFSTRKHSSLNGDSIQDTDEFKTIDQNLLTSLVRRYPEGKLFSFDHYGPISHEKTCGVSSTEITVSMKDKRDRRKTKKRAEIIRLLAVFPGARQIFFVPLYDAMFECFIGSFAWSTSDTRIFSIENDLSYLIAFGHSLMTEVSRLNSLSADRAKDQFINNVSHELRSPLHGILASAEFLSDTSMDGFQRSLVNTVDGCGRTLLDTIEHILDFSKIKKFGQGSEQSMGVVVELDVSAIIEEVLEGVYVGFEFDGPHSHSLADIPKSRNRAVSKEKKPTSRELEIAVRNDVVTIILDIDFREQWKFLTVPGIWRRLTMNLFSNALKYTPVGWIKVKLEAQSISPVNLPQHHGKETTMVILTISDSGNGISREFMKTKLFMPFSQEDATTPGTGLGMSIVKQIVDMAGGTINIRSDLGSGTHIKLSMPLESCTTKLRDEIVLSKQVSELSENPIDDVRRRAHGRTVTLRGFDNRSSTTQLQRQAMAGLKASVVRYICDWFNLSLASDESRNCATADIIISDESVFLDPTTAAGNELLNQGQILLILCSNDARSKVYASTMDSGHAIEFLSKPCGPHQLAKTILNSLDKEVANKAVVEEASLRGVKDYTQEQGNRVFSAGTPYGNTTPITGDSAITDGRITSLQSANDYSSPATDSDMTLGIYADLGSNSADLSSSNISSESDTKLLSSRPASSDNKSTSGDTNPSSAATSASTKESPESSSSDVSLARGPYLTRPKMLLVEDNLVNMMLLSTYMKKNNWDFEKGENGLLALQAFKNRPQGFDVIFMDVSMPIMTGFESTREIRKVEQARRKAGGTNRPALIIALTGFSSQDDQEMALESGVDVFMTKPVRFKEVGKILDGVGGGCFAD